MPRRSYDNARVREYWQYVWDREDAYELGEAADPTYVLGMFPYTSGTLHMGHVRNYAITDAFARYRRMHGDDVLHPMGWDAFGLPAENAAHERYTDPQSWTDACITQMREAMDTLGFGYDWSREITTCDPEYYRWNQQFFREFYEADLVEYKAAQVNWCPDCETVLADAQVIEQEGDDPAETTTTRDSGIDTPSATNSTDVCWRCETPVGTRELDQWFFTITDYADELLEGLEALSGWPESVREIQRNWIGKREGATVTFEIPGHGSVDVFTTRADTIYGATYLALAPGHPVTQSLAAGHDAVASYVESAKSGDVDDQSGLETPAMAIHPLTGEELPVYVVAYVLDDVGTGAVMGVPAHNERDYAFATEHDLPVKPVIERTEGDADQSAPITADGVLIESGEYTGLESDTVRELLLEHEHVEPDIAYRLRDWLISRQRYWGTPIPIIHCEECGPVLVPEDELPVELPEFVQTRGNPLAANEDFVKTDCPECGQPARRETDTMDTFVDSSWYFLRYLNPALETAPFDTDQADEWLPVDIYVGGEEHAVLHLLYIRFFTRALADLGYLSVREPVERLINQGTVLYNGQKMSKTKGNAISPHEYGAETTRLFVLGAAHPSQDFEWTARDVGEAYDLQQRLHGLVTEFVESTTRDGDRQHHDEYLDREIDRTIAAVTDHYESVRFHRAVTEIRNLVGLLGQYNGFDTPHEDVYRRGLSVVTRLIAPITPYLGEELWNLLRGNGLVAHTDWPTPTQSVEPGPERRVVERLRDDVRDIFDVADITDAETITIALAPAWKYRIYEIAQTIDDREPLVGTVMDDDDLREVGEPAQAYAKSLNERSQLPPVLDPEIERNLLERAAWLLTDEFGTEVTVTEATDEDQIGRARPGRPAIRIQ